MERPMEWQPIETAPKDGREIILKWDDGELIFARWAEGVRKSGWINHDDDWILYEEDDQPTEWMPRPA